MPYFEICIMVSLHYDEGNENLSKVWPSGKRRSVFNLVGSKCVGSNPVESHKPKVIGVQAHISLR